MRRLTCHVKRLTCNLKRLTCNVKRVACNVVTVTRHSRSPLNTHPIHTVTTQYAFKSRQVRRDTICSDMLPHAIFPGPDIKSDDGLPTWRYHPTKNFTTVGKGDGREDGELALKLTPNWPAPSREIATRNAAPRQSKNTSTYNQILSKYPHDSLTPKKPGFRLRIVKFHWNPF